MRGLLVGFYVLRSTFYVWFSPGMRENRKAYVSFIFWSAISFVVCGLWSGTGVVNAQHRRVAAREKPVQLDALPGHDFPLAPYIRYIPYISYNQQHTAWRLWDKGYYAQGIELLQRELRKLRGVRQERARLALAHMTLSLADQRRAVVLYGQLLASRRRDIQWPARVMLARHYIQDLQPAQAWRVLQSWPRQLPRSLRSGQAKTKAMQAARREMREIWTAGHLLRAQAATSLGQKAEASASYQGLQKAGVAIADWVAYQQLRVMAGQKRYEQIRRAAQRWQRRYRTSRWRQRVRLLQARALEKTGHCRTGIILYRRLAASRIASLSRPAQLGEVRCLLLLGQKQQAYLKLRRMLRQMAGSWYATRALQMLQWRFSRRMGLQSLYERGYHYYRARQWKKSADLLQKFIQQIHRKGRTRAQKRMARKRRKRSGRYIPMALYYHGQAMFRLKDYVACKKSLGWLMRAYPRHSLRTRAELVWIRANYRQQRNLQAVQRYERFARQHRSSVQGRRALWWAAQLYSEHQKEKHSIRLFREYYRIYPRSRRRWEARIKMALVAYQRGQYQQTIQLLQPLRRMNGGIGVRALFWTGKAYEKRKQTRQARAIFRQIRPLTDSYYAARAKQRLARRPLLAQRHISLFRLLADHRQEHQMQTEMRRWYRRHFRKQSWSALHQRVVRDESYRRAYVFALAARWRAVRQEWQVLRNEVKNPLIYYMEARAWLAYGKPHRSLYFGQRFRLKLTASQRRDLPTQPMLRLTFPIPFPYLYEQFGSRYGVRPLLMLGLTRQESLFNPRIVSGAGARGIAQIMPKEGQQMAKKWGIRNFQTRHLYRVALNLRMGFYHFREYLKRHNDDVELTLAAYNAGPRSLKRWLEKYPKLHQHDREAFIEYGIGFRETRRYVRNCLRWYSVYRMAFAKPRFPRPKTGSRAN